MVSIHFLAASIMSDVEAQEHYDRFFEDVFVEMEEKVSSKIINQIVLLVNNLVYLKPLYKKEGILCFSGFMSQ